MPSSLKKHQEQLNNRYRKRDADIIKRHKKGERMEDIASVHGVTRQRVGQIIKRASS